MVYPTMSSSQQSVQMIYNDDDDVHDNEMNNNDDMITSPTSIRVKNVDSSASFIVDEDDDYDTTRSNHQIDAVEMDYDDDNDDEDEEEEENDDENNSSSDDDNDDNNIVMPAKYNVDERVYITDPDSFLYEAVIRKMKYNVTEKCWQYFIHYIGWHKRWDEWFVESGLLPFSKENNDIFSKQKQRLIQQEKEATGASGSTGTSFTATDTTDRKRKNNYIVPDGNDDDVAGSAMVAAAADATVEISRISNDTTPVRRNVKQRRNTESTATGGTFHNNSKNLKELLSFYEDCCELPFTLKTILIEDREHIMRKGFDTLNGGYDTDMFIFDNNNNAGSNVTSSSNTSSSSKKWTTVARDVHILPSKMTIKTVLNHYIKIKKKEFVEEQEKLHKQQQQLLQKDEDNDDSEKETASYDEEALLITTNKAITKLETNYKQTRNFVNGITILFNEVLSLCLLYQPERIQFSQMMSKIQDDNDNNKSSTPPDHCETYGCEHLLRLLIKLPNLLSESNTSQISKELLTFGSSNNSSGGGSNENNNTSSAINLDNFTTRKNIGKQIIDLIVFLQKNRMSCFKAKYREPSYTELYDWEKTLVK